MAYGLRLFSTGNELKEFSQLLEEHRQLEADLTATLKKYREAFGSAAVVPIDSSFDPYSDFGKLVIWGKLLPEKGSIMDPDHRIMMAQAAYWREEVRQLLKKHTPSTEDPSNKKRKRSQLGSTEVTIDLGKQHKVSLDLQCADPLEIERRRRNAELEIIYQRYIHEHRGVPLAQVMPVFDPSTDLGKLIIGGKLLRPVEMLIAPHHQALVDEAWQLLRPNPLKAQSREARLMKPAKQAQNSLQTGQPPSQCAPAPTVAVSHLTTVAGAALTSSSPCTAASSQTNPLSSTDPSLSGITSASAAGSAEAEHAAGSTFPSSATAPRPRTRGQRTHKKRKGMPQAAVDSTAVADAATDATSAAAGVVPVVEGGGVSVEAHKEALLLRLSLLES